MALARRRPRLPASRRARLALALAALTLAVFAVHAVPARRPATTTGAVPAAPGQAVAFALPGDLAPVPGRPFAWQAVEGDGLRRCRTVVSVAAEVTDRGVRVRPSLVAYRFGGRRRELAVARGEERGPRLRFRGDVRLARVGAPPVEALLRFPAPGDDGRAVQVRTVVETFADTSSAVQRTPAYLASCARLTRERAPAALGTVEATAELVRAG